MSKPILPFVETMITQVCNLSCTGCTNYSDLQHEGYVPWSQGRTWLEAWLKRIDIPDFGIMGGEPLINPEVNMWIQGVRDLLPTSQIRFTTNGILLHKNLDIVDLLSDIGNCVFKITVHEKDTDVEDAIKIIFGKYKWNTVTEYGINRYITDNGFRFQINRPKTFLKTYQGNYSNMTPHNNAPQDAFDICCQPTCPLLYKGRIYKCSTSGLLKETLEKFNNPNWEVWKSYITEGIDANCSTEELQTFINNFGQANELCSMCPSIDDIDSNINHYDNVSTRKIKWH
jgi:uncharacterized Fe-S cluster-containing radical SAM superfamily protein